jgi:hypothetical protein
MACVNPFSHNRNESTMFSASARCRITPASSEAPGVSLEGVHESANRLMQCGNHSTERGRKQRHSGLSPLP